MERLQKSKRKSVSPVISVLLIIIIAVAASLVVYAWVMGYVGFSTQKAGKALMIQSVHKDGDTLNVYVQNVGQGSVEFDPSSCIYIDGIKYPGTPVPSTLNPGDTATITVTFQPVGDRVKIKVVATEGTFSEITWTVPSGTGGGVITVDHFDFDTIASPQTVGVSFVITIRARDSSDNVVTGYTGVNDLTVTTGTITPTFTTNFVGGVWTNTVTLDTAGTGVRLGTSGAGKVGTSNQFDVNLAAPVLNHFEFDVIGTQAVGTAFSITITAIDQYGATFTGYSGPNTLGVSVGTIDPITTTAFSGGIWTGDVTLSTAGTDIYISTSGGGKAGTSNNFDVSAAPPAFHHFTMTGYPASVLKGQSFGDVVVTACDQYGAPFTSYAGDVYFESSDPLVVLPYHALSKYTYVPATDNGVHTFDGFMLNTEGPQTITVTDGTKSTVSDPPITVNAAPVLNHFEIGTISGSQTAGTPFSITVTAKDQYDAVYTSYAGPADLTYSAGSIDPTTTSASPFVSGVWTGSVTVTKASTDVTIEANDGSIIGTSDVFDVNPAPLDHFTITAQGGGDIGTQTAGTPFGITITAVDAYDNIMTSYTDPNTNTLGVSTGTISPTSTTAFSGGAWSGQVTLNTAGTGIYITTSGGGKTGQSNTFTVNAGALDHFTVTAQGGGNIGTQTAGTPFSITVTAYDFYNNIKTDYAGPATLSDLSTSITPPSTGTFTNGAVTPSVTIANIYTNDRITATDSGKTGQSNTFNVNAAPHSVTLLSDGFETKWWMGSEWYRSNDQHYGSGSWSIKSDENNEGDFISGSINALGGTSITVDFYYMVDDTEAGELVLYFYNGGSYVQIADLGDNAEDTWNHYTYTTSDSQYLKSNFRIRLDANMNDNSEHEWVDTIQVTVTGGAGTTFTEGFESALTNWDINWNEISTTNWDQDINQQNSGSFSAQSDQNDEGDFITDNLDANDAVSITVDFYYMVDDTEAGELVLYFYNGGSYVQIADLGDNAEDTWNHYTYTTSDSQYLKSNFRIRLDSDMNDWGENIWVDNVLITKQVP